MFYVGVSRTLTSTKPAPAAPSESRRNPRFRTVALGVLAILIFSPGTTQAGAFDVLGFEPSPSSLAAFRLKRGISGDVQRTNSYRAAREFMFSQLDNVNGQVEGVYSGREIQTRNIPDTNLMNTEHSFAQSWFKNRLPATEAAKAKADVHHLFPTLSHLNSLRGSLPFGEVSDRVPPLEGGSRCDGNQFEPRDNFKGNIARALFYFSARYGVSIPDNQEPTLRRWNQQDPVDQAERAREQGIFEFQGNHNPFVQDSTLVERIGDF